MLSCQTPPLSEAITWIAEPWEEAAPGPEQLLRALAKRCGLELPSPQQGVLRELGASQEGQSARAACVVEVGSISVAWQADNPAAWCMAAVTW